MKDSPGEHDVRVPRWRMKGSLFEHEQEHEGERCLPSTLYPKQYGGSVCLSIIIIISSSIPCVCVVFYSLHIFSSLHFFLVVFLFNELQRHYHNSEHYTPFLQKLILDFPCYFFFLKMFLKHQLQLHNWILLAEHGS